MAKIKKNQKSKSHLSPEDKLLGKRHVSVIVAMMVIGIAIALYGMQ